MITIKTKEEIEIMREAGRILATVLEKISEMVRPGVKTIELDRAAEALILSMGAKPAFKGYEGFPFSLCASVNEVLVHGLPSDYILKEGDVIGLDLGVIYKGLYSDSAVTVGVGNISQEAKNLMIETKKSLEIGIKEAIIGNTTGDIGNAIFNYIEKRGYGVIRDLCGHGIGRDLHEDPKIPNYGNKGKGDKLIDGMIICIEPIISIGDYRIKKAPDGFGYQTKDGSLSAHFEHTIAITKNGPEILTKI